KVGATPERLAGWRQEHRQWPAARLSQQRERRLVNGVEIRALFAIDLDVDEQLVHQPGDAVILETLMRHDVAPVTGGLADREQDRRALWLCRRQRLRPPGLPVHWVVLVLEQVGAGLAIEVVAHSAPVQVTKGRGVAAGGMFR